MDRETHFDSRGRLIANAKLVWGSPDISPKFALIQEVRCVYNLRRKYIGLVCLAVSILLAPSGALIAIPTY